MASETVRQLDKGMMRNLSSGSVLVLGELGWPLSEANVIERFVGRPDRQRRASGHLSNADEFPAQGDRESPCRSHW